MTRLKQINERSDTVNSSYRSSEFNEILKHPEIYHELVVGLCNKLFGVPLPLWQLQLSNMWPGSDHFAMQHKLHPINFPSYYNCVSAGSKSSVTFSLGLTAGNFIFTGLLAGNIIKSAKSITSSNVHDCALRQGTQDWQHTAVTDI